MNLQATTSQTVGPYFSIGLTRLKKSNLVGPGVSGERVTIAGRVLDGDSKPVPDAMLEIWKRTAKENIVTLRTSKTNHSSQTSRATVEFYPMKMENLVLRQLSLAKF